MSVGEGIIIALLLFVLGALGLIILNIEDLQTTLRVVDVACTP